MAKTKSLTEHLIAENEALRAEIRMLKPDFDMDNFLAKQIDEYKHTNQDETCIKKDRDYLKKEYLRLKDKCTE